MSIFASEATSPLFLFFFGGECRVQSAERVGQGCWAGQQRGTAAAALVCQTCIQTKAHLTRNSNKIPSLNQLWRQTQVIIHMLCCLTSKTRGCAAEWQRRGIASFLQKATFLCVKISQNFPLSCVTFTYLITFKCAGQKQHKQTGKMAIQSKLSRVHVWHSGSTAVQSTQIWGANRTTRLATVSRQRAVHWTAMRGAPRDLQGRTNQAPRQDWSERPWRTGRWHTRRRKKKKKVQIYSLIIAVGNYRSSTHTHTGT